MGGGFAMIILVICFGIIFNTRDRVPRNPPGLRHSGLRKSLRHQDMHVSSLTGASVTPQYEAHEADASKFYVKQYGGRSKRYRKSKKYSKTKSKSRTRRGGRRSRRVRRIKRKSRR